MTEIWTTTYDCSVTGNSTTDSRENGQVKRPNYAVYYVT